MFCGKKVREGKLKLIDVGLWIGVKVSLIGELYFFVNGIKFGFCVFDVFVDRDFYVVVDVYGIIKWV